MKSYQKRTALILALVLLLFSARAQTKTGFHSLKDMPIGSNGGWDQVRAGHVGLVDGHLGRLVARRGDVGVVALKQALAGPREA